MSKKEVMTKPLLGQTQPRPQRIFSLGTRVWSDNPGQNI